MSAEMILLAALAGVAVLFALGVLVSSDNFYSALFMSVTLVLVATIYAFFSLQPVFVLILFVFVGAIGIVTVALAATYRTAPEQQVSWFWAIPVALTALILVEAISFYPLGGSMAPGTINFQLVNFMAHLEYLLLVVFLIALVLLLLLSVLKMGVGGRS